MILRQGNILLRKVYRKPKGQPIPNIKRINRLILGMGETGAHVHAVVHDGDARLLRNSKGRTWLEVPTSAVLKHGEPVTLEGGDHDAISLKSGIYEVIQQRFYIPGGNAYASD